MSIRLSVCVLTCMSRTTVQDDIHAEPLWSAEWIKWPRARPIALNLGTDVVPRRIPSPDSPKVRPVGMDAACRPAYYMYSTHPALLAPSAVLNREPYYPFVSASFQGVSKSSLHPRQSFHRRVSCLSDLSRTCTRSGLAPHPRVDSCFSSPWPGL